MSCAKPIVGSDAAGNRLAIREGVNGFLVPERDDAALAAALARLIADADLRAAWAQPAGVLIDTELGWPQLARRYADSLRVVARREGWRP